MHPRGEEEIFRRRQDGVCQQDDEAGRACGHESCTEEKAWRGGAGADALQARAYGI